MNIHVLIRSRPDRNNLQLYYVNPLTGKEKSRSAKTADRAKANRAAARWEEELASGLDPTKANWTDFRNRFEAEHLAQLAFRTRGGYSTALTHFENLVGKPMDLMAINASVVSRFASLMRAEKIGEQSIATYLTHLRAALRWAASIGMIPYAPTIKLPKLGKRKLNRGRPLTAKEFQAMVDAVPGVVGKEFAAEWVRALRGAWLCGLRLGEVFRLSWDSAPARVDLDSGRFPRIIWFIEGQKARRDDVVPMTPDFADFLRETPAASRKGRVFNPKLATRRVTSRYAGKVISAIGVAAQVLVNEKGKHASAHDLRRSFGTRWAMKVRPVTLQALMRHASIETTLKFYVDLHCDDVGAELWGVTAVENDPTCDPNSKRNQETQAVSA